MVQKVLKYYLGIAMSQKRYSIPPLLLAPIAQIGTDYIQPLFTAAIIDALARADTPTNTYVWYGVGFFGAPFVAELIWRYIIWSMNIAESRGAEKIANETFSDLMSRSYDFHVNNFAGSLVAKAGRFVGAYVPLFDTAVMDIAGTFTGLVFATIVLLKISPPAGITILVILLIFGHVITRLTRYRYKLSKQRAEEESVLTGQLADSLANAITVKAFAKEAVEQKRYAQIAKRVQQKTRRTWDFQNMPMDFITTNTVNVLNTVALISGIIAVRNGVTQVGTMVVILLYVRNLTRIFWDMSRVMRNVESNLSNAVEMMQILEQPKEVTDEQKASELMPKGGQIQINELGFSYGKDSKDQGLFESLSITIPSGQSVGLVGPSGGGKTTIMKLLLRFMDVREGSITIDGQNIASVSQKSLRDTITYVPQEPLLFHRSLRENIAYGRPGASMKQVIAAAKKANAHDFILSLPDGYETLVGERGIKLSGGQRQRVALARAILKNAPIIVLDEATSALDSESEKLIQDALFKLMEGRTTIVVAHRLSTIKHLDRIIVLEDGKITEDGTHETLIKKKTGTYARLWAHQSGGFIE